jgi:hypothetical protein
MSEPDHFVRAHVATDHALRQARLKRLIDDASAIGEIRIAARHELGEEQGLRLTASPCFQYGYQAAVRRRGSKFNLPDDMTAIAAVLLNAARAI